MKKYLFAAIFSSVFCALSAQNADVIKSLAKPDSVTGATVTVAQDETVSYFLQKKSGTTDNSALKKGWCVQVFSENSASAKDMAFSIEKKIKAKFPNENVRAERISPFWKVRVGKFATLDEANALKELLIKEFAEYKSGIYAVRFSE
ncbi:MAG: SPOR domain-containing protein [Prevotellaceae bacterium]|jgi:hypothetical protein|nr:SPOR domain-containing protein [Prevotellaceae bacterium]